MRIYRCTSLDIELVVEAMSKVKSEEDSIEYIVKNNYIPRLINSLPQNEEMDKIFAHVNSFIDNRLKLKC